MILRVDRLETELPPPSDADPAGAAAAHDLRSKAGFAKAGRS